jgi:hypothetical protein
MHQQPPVSGRIADICPQRVWSKGIRPTAATDRTSFQKTIVTSPGHGRKTDIVEVD